MKYWETILNLKNNLNGLLDQLSGVKLTLQYLPHREHFYEHCLSNYQIDVTKVFNLSSGILKATELEEQFACRLNGFNCPQEYRQSVSSCFLVKKIKIPVLFYFSFDDPVIGANSIDFKSIKQNENCVLATTQFGSHLCNFENLMENRQWIVDMGLNFVS